MAVSFLAGTGKKNDQTQILKHTDLSEAFLFRGNHRGVSGPASRCGDVQGTAPGLEMSFTGLFSVLVSQPVQARRPNLGGGGYRGSGGVPPPSLEREAAWEGGEGLPVCRRKGHPLNSIICNKQRMSVTSVSAGACVDLARARLSPEGTHSHLQRPKQRGCTPVVTS